MNLEPQDLCAALAERARADALRLPVLPTVAIELLASVDDEDCDARSLAVRVQEDPSLAAHVLRAANSARYAPKEPIVSLTQAIGRLGLAALREIVVSVAVKGATFDVRGHERYVAGLWRHALLAGRLAQEIARARRANVEAAFLCGLLHDIGAPVALQGLIDHCKAQGLAPSEATLLAAVDLAHAELGALLAERWRLPDWVRAAVRFHDAPEHAPKHAELVRTTALADALATWLLEQEGAGVPPGLEHAAALDLYDEELEGLSEKGADLLADVEAAA